MWPSGILLAAHGTRSAQGRAVVEQLRSQLEQRLSEPVRLGWVDVAEPHVDELIAPGDLVVPAFLGAGYHVKHDLPRSVARADGAVLTAHLGPHELVLDAVHQRVVEAGGPWPLTLLGWAGSSDPESRAEAGTAAALLASRWGVTVRVVTPAELPQAVAAGRAEGFERVGVASYLLAPGFFADKLADGGADGCSAPIGAHPCLVDLLCERVRAPLALRTA
ncbi:sirohydrochlorin chelatase [Luteococcus peritonei]|uniref:Sirohydrochlorin chelatase n=1 Tax=Luteococcus peritonei TaxID=88874 RepID=A0ABW4RVB6_9ACTN